MLLLTRSDVARLLDMAAVIEAVEQAHADLARGRAFDLGPASVPVDGSSALLVPMAASIPGGSAGVKVLTDTPANPGQLLPRQQSTIVLVDTGTGACEAVLDGAAITAHRTAAASAVATKYLARDDARVLGLVGAGRLARAHLEAIRLVRPVEQVFVWSRSAATSSAFAAWAAPTGLVLRVSDAPQEVVSVSDIVCTLTPSAVPLVRGSWFRPGVHVNAVGAPPRPDHREIDTEGIRRSRVVVDSYEVASHKAGELLIPLSEGAITEADFRDELGQVVLGQRPARTSADEVTLYKSVGLAIQDVATARLVVAAARRTGTGTDVSLRV
jgi:alanine dehydrogenase